MYRNPIFINLFCTFLLLPLASQAQRFETGLHAGFSYFMGDITDRMNAINVGFGGHFTYCPHPKIAARLDLMNLFLSGDDKGSPSAYKQNRGFKFLYNVQEVSLMGELRPFDSDKLSHIGHFEQSITPYGFGGAGLLTRVSGKAQAPLVETSPFPEAGDTKTTFPFLIGGGGLRWHFAQRYKLSAEGSGRYYFSDYVDGISNSANPKSKDLSFFGNLTLTYILDMPIGVRKRNWFLL
jgi:hypothetical protein